MDERAEVIGVVRQLTVPSRSSERLVDVWIALEGQIANEGWNREFAARADRHLHRLSATGRIQLVPLGDSQGWMVARCVDARRIGLEELEELARTIVAEVNAAVTSAPAQDEESRPILGSVGRARSTLLQAGLALANLWTIPRKSGDADIASSS